MKAYFSDTVRVIKSEGNYADKGKNSASNEEFNRFYMSKMRLLDNHYLGLEYSPTEARVLFEVYENDGCNATYIAKTINIDKSYLSRIIKAHEKSGYLIRSVSQKDSRSFDLHLTEALNTVTDILKD